MCKTSSWLQDKSSTLAWPALAWPGQSGTFVLKSSGGFVQVEWSHCTCMLSCPSKQGRFTENILQNLRIKFPKHTVLWKCEAYMNITLASILCTPPTLSQWPLASSPDAMALLDMCMYPIYTGQCPLFYFMHARDGPTRYAKQEVKQEVSLYKTTSSCCH